MLEERKRNRSNSNNIEEWRRKADLLQLLILSNELNMKIIVWLLAALCIGAYINRPIEDPDLWWHLTVGKWIISQRAIPHMDMWTIFSAGQPWRAYSWSNEVVYALFERFFGIQGVVFLHFALAAALALSLFYCLGRVAHDWFFGALLGILVTANCFQHFSLRPQTLTWICFVWLLLTAEKILQEGLKKKHVAAIIFWLCLWANTHISAILGLFAITIWAFKRERLGSSLFMLLIGFFGTLLTPYFGGEWLTFFSKAHHPFTYVNISEFRPATILHYSTGLLLLLIFLLIAFWQRAPRLLGLAQILVAAVFVLGGLAVVKFIPFAAIAVAMLLARVWAKSSVDPMLLGSYREAIECLRALKDKVSGEGFAFLLLCLSVVNVWNVVSNPVNDKAVPVKAVEYIKTLNLPHPLLNAFTEGGYLMYAFSNSDGSPEHRVSIDGRTNLITNEYWKKYSAAFQGQENWREYIEAVKPQTILWPSASPLCSILLADGNWCRVYRDSGPEWRFSVFVQRSFFDQHKELFPRSSCSS